MSKKPLKFKDYSQQPIEDEFQGYLEAHTNNDPALVHDPARMRCIREDFYAGVMVAYGLLQASMTFKKLEKIEAFQKRLLAEIDQFVSTRTTKAGNAQAYQDRAGQDS